MREINIASIQPKRQPHLSPFRGETDRDAAAEKMELNIAMAERLILEAGADGCDLAVYPEDIQGTAHYGYYMDDKSLFGDFVEAVPGPITDRIGAAAKKANTNVVFGVFQRDGETIYNASVLMSRTGKILGIYHKVQLPASERWAIRHGEGFPVFEADFGKVGMLVCYDMMFPEVARALSLNGAEILCSPTMGYSGPDQCDGNGLLRVRVRAMDSFAPIVVSKSGNGSLIVDSRGNLLAESESGQEQILRARIDLDDTPNDPSQWEVITGTANCKARFLQERLPEVYGDIVNGSPPVVAQYENDRLRESEDERMAAYREIHKRWTS